MAKSTICILRVCQDFHTTPVLAEDLVHISARLIDTKCSVLSST